MDAAMLAQLEIIVLASPRYFAVLGILALAGLSMCVAQLWLRRQVGFSLGVLAAPVLILFWGILGFLVQTSIAATAWKACLPAKGVCPAASSALSAALAQPATAFSVDLPLAGLATLVVFLTRKHKPEALR
jgi:hypothetical protein